MSETPTPATSTAAQPCAGRLARWSPTLLGLAFAGLGLGAIGFAQSGLEIRVPQAPSDSPDPLALLRDDVGTLQGDLAALSQGLGSNLEALATGLDGAAEERYREQSQALAALQKRLAALEAQLATEARSARAERRALGEARTGSTGAGGSGAKGGGSASEAAKTSRGDTEPVQPADPGPLAEGSGAPSASEPSAPEPAAEEAPPARKRGLFSFKMTEGLDFAQRQRYEVIGSLSRVGFDAKSTLHDFSGVTTEVSGFFTGRLDASGSLAGKVAAKVAELKTGVSGRDEEMLKVLEASQHPELAFALERLEVQQSDPAAHTARAVAHGTFTIRGVGKPLAVPLEFSVDRSRRLVVAGEVKLLLSEFGVEPPTVAGAIKVEDEVKIWISLRLRSMGAVEEGK